MAMIIVTGTVVDAATGRGVTAARVEIVGHGLATPFSSTTTFASGDFRVSIGEEVDIVRAFGDRARILEFRVVREGQSLPIKEGATLPFRTQSLKVLIKVEVTAPPAEPPLPRPAPAPSPPPTAVPSPPPAGSGCVVSGTVRLADGTPFPGARVVAFEQSIKIAKPLGETQTDMNGAYSIRYASRGTKGSERTDASLFVRVFAVDDTIATESELWCNSPCEAVVDLMIGGGRYGGPSEYETIVTTIAPLLDGAAIPALTKDQVVFLSCRTGLDRQQIQYLVWAQKRGREQDIPAEALYGFARKQLPTALPGLFGQTPSVWRRALERALVDNLIPLTMRARLDEVEKRMLAAAVRYIHQAPGYPPQATVTPLLVAAGLSADEQQTFLSHHVASQGSADLLWKAVGGDPSLAPKTARIQLAIQVAAITRNHPPLLTAIMHTPNNPITSARDLAKLPLEAWKSLIATSGTPEDVPGADADEKASNYARTIGRTMEVFYPTTVFAARLKGDAARATPALNQFFERNPDFDLRETHVDAYVGEHAATALADVDKPEALVADLKRVQRVLRLTPRYEDVQRLLDHKLDSAQGIVQLGRTTFLERHGDAIGADRAEDIYDRARQIAAAAALLFARYAPQMNAINLAVIANPAGKRP